MKQLNMKIFREHVNKKKQKKKTQFFKKICVVFHEVYIIIYTFFLVPMLKVLSTVNLLIRPHPMLITS